MQWVVFGIVVAAILVGAAVFLFRWVRRMEAAARQARADRTQAEIEGEGQRALSKEKERSDQEALEQWQSNFGK